MFTVFQISVILALLGALIIVMNIKDDNKDK